MARVDRYKDIQLPQLRSFCLAATEGNFTSAAKALGLSAPTVWQQVRALERRLRTTLLRRRGRNVELTPEGQALLELVQPHVSGLDSLETLFLARQAALPQQLTVAAIPYLVSSHLVQPVRTFSAEYPDVRLKLQVCVWFEEVARLVEQGQADVGVLFCDEEQPRSPHLDYQHLFRLRLALLLPKGHALARKKQLHARDLASQPLIVPPEGAYARTALERMLHRHRLADQVHVVLETALLDIIMKYVAAGVGVGLVHIGPEAELLPGVQARPFAAPRDDISAAVVARKGAHPTEHALAFRRMLAKEHG